MRSRTSATALGCALVLAAAFPVAAATKAELRSTGGDRTTALRIATVLLAQPLDMQLLRVRCERVGAQSFCGLVLSGVKFHRRLDTSAFERDVDDLVHGALAVDPAIAEVDVWVTVPASTGKGAVVSGDFAVPTAATVFAMTAPRTLAGSPSTSANVFWDPAFRRELDAGSLG